MPQPARFTRLNPDLVRMLSRFVDANCPASLKNHRDDIVQQILVRLHRISLEQPLKLGPAYLRRAARHGVCDAWRRQTQRASESAKELPCRAPNPEHEVSQRRAVAVARTILDTLPTARREAVSLYLQGRRINEIADTLGCPRKRADNLVYRGLSSLRTRMHEHGYGPACAVAP